MKKRILALLLALFLLWTPIGTNATEGVDSPSTSTPLQSSSDVDVALDEFITGDEDALTELSELDTPAGQGDIELDQAIQDLAENDEDLELLEDQPEMGDGTSVIPGVEDQADSDVVAEVDPEPVTEGDDMLPDPEAEGAAENPEGKSDETPSLMEDDVVSTDPVEPESGNLDPENVEPENPETEKPEGEQSTSGESADFEQSAQAGTDTQEDSNTQESTGLQEGSDAQEGDGTQEENDAQESPVAQEGDGTQEEAQSQEKDPNQTDDMPAEEGDPTAEETEGTATEEKDPAEENPPEGGEETEETAEGEEASSEEEEESEEEDPELAEANTVPKIVLSKTVLTLGKNEILWLKATDEDPEGGALRWAVANGKIATINQAGAVKGNKVGTTWVRVTNSKGVYADCTVVVKAAPRGIKVSPSTVYVSVGDRVQVYPWPKTGACSTYTYSSRSNKIAVAGAGGWIYGVKQGKTTVTVRSYNKKKAKVKVVVVAPPSYVAVSPVTRTLGVGQTFKLGTAVQRNTTTTFTFSSSDETVATVNGSGYVTAVALGTAVITARSHNGKTASCTVTVKEAPTGISVNLTDYECAVGDKRQGSATLYSADSYADILWSSGNTRVVTVAANGIITAVGKGETTVYANTYVPGVTASFHVKVYAAPASVSAGKTAVDFVLGYEETLDLTATIPEYTRTTFTFTSSDPSIATVTSLDPENAGVLKEQEGFRLNALKRGRTTVTVTTANGKKAQIAVRVMDPNIPEEITLTASVPTINAGNSHKLSLAIVPSTATGNANLSFSSNDTSVATVSADGTIKGVALGVARITVVSGTNPEAVLNVPVMVYAGGLITRLPAVTTSLAAGASAIQENLLRIKAVENSAHWMVNSLRASGAISAADANRRNSIITNAFKDYAFPWITTGRVAYWKWANSERGAKDYKPGIVYYGMPYMSGTGVNRCYNAGKALAEKRWTSSGSYYTLNRGRLLNGKYVGNDCSSFVNAAIWGPYSKRITDRTKNIAKIRSYKTVKNYLALRPGDLICKSKSHVVMFLYFANAAKTKIMVIENGGIWAGTNTVHCAIYDAAWFAQRKYKIRRLSNLP